MKDKNFSESAIVILRSYNFINQGSLHTDNIISFVSIYIFSFFLFQSNLLNYLNNTLYKKLYFQDQKY